jgi:flagellar biogenesis protein FliO
MAFFGGMPFPVQFFLAFVIVLGLIGATAWAVRRFGTGALGGPHLRGRQPRLAVLEHTLVEGRRRLYLVRRDNVEHLLLIGGPTDIVVEPNIVRATAAARETPVARPPAPADTLARAIPLPDSPGNGSWPLQPEPMAPVGARPMRIEHDEHPAWPLQPQGEPSRTQRDALAALEQEVAPRPPQPRNRGQGHARPAGEPRPAPVQYIAPEPAADADQSLAEMAHRLEAALRKPSVKNEPHPSPAPRVVGPDEQAPVEDITAVAPPVTPPLASPPPRGPRVADAKAPRPEGKQANGSAGGKTLYDSLEQEMASLLGRPAGKT